MPKYTLQGDGSVNLKDANGVYNLPEAEAIKALESGQALPATNQEVRDWTENEKLRKWAADNPGKAAINAFTKGITLGLAPNITNPEDPEAAKALEEENPWASGAGMIGSYLLPFGPVGLAGKAIRGIKAATTAGKVARAGAAFGAEGALVSATDQIANNQLTGQEVDPTALATGAAIGVATGGVLSALGKAASKGVKALQEKALKNVKVPEASNYIGLPKGSAISKYADEESIYLKSIKNSADEKVLPATQPNPTNSLNKTLDDVIEANPSIVKSPNYRINEYLRKSPEEQLEILSRNAVNEGRPLVALSKTDDILSQWKTRLPDEYLNPLGSVSQSFKKEFNTKNILLELLTSNTAIGNIVGWEYSGLKLLGNWMVRQSLKKPIPQVAQDFLKTIGQSAGKAIRLSAVAGFNPSTSPEDMKDIRVALDTADGRDELTQVLKEADAKKKLETAVKYAVNPLEVLDDVSKGDLLKDNVKIDLAAKLQPELFDVIQKTAQESSPKENNLTRYRKPTNTQSQPSITTNTAGSQLANLLKANKTLDNVYKTKDVNKLPEERKQLIKQIRKIPQDAVPMAQQIMAMSKSQQPIPEALSADFDVAVRKSTGISNASELVTRYTSLKFDPKDPLTQLPLFTSFNDSASESLQGKISEHAAKAFFSEFSTTIPSGDSKSAFKKILSTKSPTVPKKLSDKEIYNLQKNLETVDKNLLDSAQEEDIARLQQSLDSATSISSGANSTAQIALLKEKFVDQSYSPAVLSNYYSAITDPRTILLRADKRISTAQDVEILNRLYPEVGNVINLMCKEGIEQHNESIQEKNKSLYNNEERGFLNLWITQPEPTQMAINQMPPQQQKQQDRVNINLDVKPNLPVERATANIT